MRLFTVSVCTAVQLLQPVLAWLDFPAELHEYQGRFEGSAANIRGMQVFLPKPGDTLREQWIKAKSAMFHRTGRIEETFPTEIRHLRNTEVDLDSLISLANGFAPALVALTASVAQAFPETRYHVDGTGPVKTREYLDRKIQSNMKEGQVSRAFAVRHVGDALGATISVRRPEDVAMVVKHVKDSFAGSRNGTVVSVANGFASPLFGPAA